MTEDILRRIADALERLAPPAPASADAAAHPAYVWNGVSLQATRQFAPTGYDLLQGVDAQKSVLLANVRRHAQGLPAHDALLWGARGTGKSASVGAVVAKLQGEGHDLALVQCESDRLDSLPTLFDLLAGVDRRFILFIDDIGFGDEDAQPRLLRSLLDGGANARPANVRLCVTSNRRHIVSRHMSEQDDPINKRDVVDDKLALADRFGLSLGFHNVDQDTYLAIVESYARAYDLPFDGMNAVQWATQRGSRSGRVAWQYIVDLAGREGKALPR